MGYVDDVRVAMRRDTAMRTGNKTAGDGSQSFAEPIDLERPAAHLCRTRNDSRSRHIQKWRWWNVSRILAGKV